MKQTVYILTIFLLTILISCGQKPQKTKSANGQQEFIDSLKKNADQKWIRENPELSTTKSSFFNEDNESKYFVGLLQISGQGFPFTWDDNLSLLQFLMIVDNKTNVKHG